MLSHEYWTRQFGQDPHVVGRIILVNGQPVTVTGITPADLFGLYPGNQPDVYLPLTRMNEFATDSGSLAKPDHWWLQLFARMQPSANEKRAGATANSVFLNQLESYSGRKLSDVHIELDSRARGLTLLRDRLSNRVYILWVAVALVLLIACVNMANLLLARATARRREMAVRLSLGASRRRLLRQLLTEGTLLSLAAGALGVLLAKPVIRLLLTLDSGEALEIRAALDLRALCFALALSLVTGLLFSAMPASRATRVDLSPALKDGGLAGSETRHGIRLGRLLVACQVALSLLLIGAGLFLRTLIGLQAVKLGFNAGNLLTFRIDPGPSGVSDKEIASLYFRIRESIEHIPGVTSVAFSRHALIDGSETSSSVRIAS